MHSSAAAAMHHIAVRMVYHKKTSRRRSPAKSPALATIPGKLKMAFVPDEAIRRRNEVSSGAFALYVHLCMFRCNKQDSKNFGLAFPSQQTLIEEMGMTRQHISALIAEIVKKRWIRKESWRFRLLIGFEQPGLEYRSLRVARPVVAPYIKDRTREDTVFASDNVYYAIPDGSTTYIKVDRGSRFPERRYQTHLFIGPDVLEFSDVTNCQESQTALSEKSAESSEFSDTHDRNQQRTKKEPDRETRAQTEFLAGDELSDPAVLYWWQICQRRRRDPTYPFRQRLPGALTIGMAERIAGRVSDLDVWRETVDFWSGNDYQLQHVMTILENYRERLLNKSKQQGANDASRHDEAKRIREERRRAGSADGHYRSRSQHLRTA